MTPGEAIEARVAEFRAALEACAAEGFDPATMYVTSSVLGSVWMHPRKDGKDGRLSTEAEARTILARLADGVAARSDAAGTGSSYEVGGFLVFAERHPDAPTFLPDRTPDGD